MRKLLTFIVYTIIILLIGRNLTALPKFYVFSSPEQERDQFTKNLKTETQKTLKELSGNYAVYYADFNDKHEAFGIADREMFTAASVNKVPIVAVLYYLNNKGKIDLDEKVTLQRADIQDYGSGTLQYQKPGSIYTLKTLAKLSLQQSDNTAAHILARRIGMDVIQKTINGWGLTQTEMENNQTTVYDMYVLFKKMYKTEITSEARTREFFSYLLDTDIEDRLPALLPKDADVYHKTGDAVGSYHDIGIIKQGDHIFFLAVLTSDSQDNGDKAKNTTALLAKKILDAYNTKD